MPSNGMNYGVDYNFGLYDANTGVVLDLGDVQSIDIKALKHDLASHPYNKDPRFAFIQAGYSGTITIVRTGSVLEDLQVVFAAQVNSGSIIKPGYLNQITTNPDGTVSKYQYTGVVFFMTDVGNISREKTVTQSLAVMASSKIKLA